MEVFQFFPLLFPLFFIGGMFFLVSFLNKQVFKDLLSRFDTVSQIPEGSIRPEIFRFGNSILRNSVSLAEEGDSIVVKIMMIPAFRVPYGTFSSIHQDKNVFTFKFKEEMEPIYIVLRPDQLEKFPRLKAKVSTETVASVGTKKPTFKADLISPSIDTLQIKSFISNAARGVILICLIIAALIYANVHWGL